MQLQQTIAGLGLSCQWVQDESACLAALSAGDISLLVCDLSLVEQDAISLLMNQPQLQEAGLPIVLLSAHEQTLNRRCPPPAARCRFQYSGGAGQAA